MKVLVTGASGQLGGHIAALLADRGDIVRALVRRTSKRTHLVKLPNIEFFEAGLDEPELLNAAVAGVDAIVHAAGIVKARNLDEFFTVNVGGTSNLIEAARLRAPELRRFVYVSSLEACGPSVDGKPVPVTQENPVTAYGRSKLAAEKVVLAAKDAVPVVILRPGAIYGPRDVEIFAAFQFIHRGLLPLVGGGRAKAVWIYGADCAAACVRAVSADVPSGRVYFRRRRLAVRSRSARCCSMRSAHLEREPSCTRTCRACVHGRRKSPRDCGSRDGATGDAHTRKGQHAPQGLDSARPKPHAASSTGRRRSRGKKAWTERCAGTATTTGSRGNRSSLLALPPFEN